MNHFDKIRIKAKKALQITPQNGCKCGCKWIDRLSSASNPRQSYRCSDKYFDLINEYKGLALGHNAIKLSSFIYYGI
jgi:hypothetical protein